jgi:hypothetical protein
VSPREREITAEVALCDARGRLAEAARGWARGPRHRCEVPGPWGRRKRWHHWCVTSDREVVALTFADLDYAGLAVIQVIDRASGDVVTEQAIRPLGWRAPLPPTAGAGRVDVAHGGVSLCFDDASDVVTLRARGRRVACDVTVTRPAGHETLGVVAPWSASRFAYTSKQNTLPAAGTLTVDGRTRAIAPGAWACLDYGRGVWPAHTRWNWAAASGVQGGRVVGFNLGARWTDGTGATENALCVDGRLTKISDDVRFSWDPREPRLPWRLAGGPVELTLVPEVVRRVRPPGALARVLGDGLCLAFGAFSGRIGDVAVTDLFGWAEELEVRW